MTIIHSPEAPRFDLPGLVFTGLASPSRGSTDLCTWHLRVEPGFASPDAHTLDRDEVFMVLAGSIALSPDEAPVGPVARPSYPPAPRSRSATSATGRPR